MAQGQVQGIDRPVAFAYRVVNATVDLEFDNGFDFRAGHVLAVDRAVVDEFERVANAAQYPPRENLKRGFSRFKHIALVRELLNFSQQFLHGGMAFVQARDQVIQFCGNRAPARLFRQEKPALVAHPFRAAMLVRGGLFEHGIHVNPGLVCKRAFAHVRLAVVVVHIGYFADKAGQFHEFCEICRANRCFAQLELDIGNDRTQIGIATAFAVSVDRALHVHRPHFERDNAVGHGHARVVVRVNAQRHGEFALNGRDDLLNFVGHRAAIGVAQGDHLRAAGLRGLQGAQCVFGIGFVPVEKVLGVVDDFPAVFLEPRAGIRDDLQIFVERCPQDVGDVQGPTFPKERDDRCAGPEQGGEGRVVFGRIAHAAGAAKGHDFGIAKFAVAHALKKLEVLGIGRIRPTAFDVVNAHRVETLRDHGFVFSRKRNALGLRAISKGGVVNLHQFRHVIFPMRRP